MFKKSALLLATIGLAASGYSEEVGGLFSNDDNSKTQRGYRNNGNSNGSSHPIVFDASVLYGKVVTENTYLYNTSGTDADDVLGFSNKLDWGLRLAIGTLVDNAVCVKLEGSYLRMKHTLKAGPLDVNSFTVIVGDSEPLGNDAYIIEDTTGGDISVDIENTDKLRTLDLIFKSLGWMSSRNFELDLLTGLRYIYFERYFDAALSGDVTVKGNLTYKLESTGPFVGAEYKLWLSSSFYVLAHLSAGIPVGNERYEAQNTATPDTFVTDGQHNFSPWTQYRFAIANKREMKKSQWLYWQLFYETLFMNRQNRSEQFVNDVTPATIKAQIFGFGVAFDF